MEFLPISLYPLGSRSSAQDCLARKATTTYLLRNRDTGYGDESEEGQVTEVQSLK